MKKQLLLLLMVCLPMMAWADASGTCGDNLTWTYVESTNTLTISGSGEMKDWSSYRPAWYSYLNNITNVRIVSGVTSIGSSAFYGCTKLSSISIPNSVTSIGSSAFYNCTSLTSITIPNSVTSIGSGAFAYCIGLTSVTIGNSVTSIGDYAFYNCSGLTDFYSYAELVPTVGIGTFLSSPVSTATLHVPSASIEAYKAADQWKDFGTFVALTPEETSVKSIKAEENKSVRKFMEDGRLVIQKDGQRYNAAGQMIK